jgi:long-chain acyl-CoA synthetase
MRAKIDGGWRDITHRQFADQVQDLSLGLLELGVHPGDRVAILSENRPEWAVADYACLAACCTDIPIYPTLTPKQIEHILRDSGAIAIFVSNEALLDKILAIRGGLPELRYVIAFDPAACRDGATPLGEVLARGHAARPRHLTWREDALRVRPDDLATLIYTSGTTGDPKGVMLTHGNIAFNVTACRPLFDFRDDEGVSFLPLSHIFERMLGHYTMFHVGGIISYAESLDTVAADMVNRRPSVMAAVPRLYEKIYGRVLDAVQAGTPLRKRIFFWAKGVGERWAELKVEKRPIPAGLAWQHRIADALVFRKIRGRLGGQIRLAISGGAPLAPELARFFYGAGLPILEGYGLTETSPVIAVNTFEHHRFGTVGRPIPGVEVKIAPDGEILTRGPHVMRGYYRKPDATAEAIDADGWFHTGDIGELDADGFLRITDRKKDLIVTAGGKNIAPQPIENLAKQSKYVTNAVILGDRRPFPVMLVVPNFERLRRWARHRPLPADDVPALLAHPDVQEKMAAEVERALGELAPFERPKKLLLLAQDFSVEADELTPTLKVRRRIVEARHRAAIEALYREG